MRVALACLVMFLCGQPEAPPDGPRAPCAPAESNLEVGVSAPTRDRAASSDLETQDTWTGTGLRQSVDRVLRLFSSEDVEWWQPDATWEAAPRQNAVAEPVLAGMARAAEPEVRLRAIEGLAGSSTRPALKQLVEGLADPSGEVRAAATRALAKTDPNLLFEYVISDVTGGDAQNIAALDAALPEFRTPLAKSMLETLESTQEAPERVMAAAYCLGRMGCREAASALAAGTWSTDPAMADTCAEALYALRVPESVPVWIKLAQHPMPTVRGVAVQALSGLGGREAFEALRVIAQGGTGLEGELQCAATRGLAGWPKPDAVPVLIDVMEKNGAMRPCAAEQLRRLTGMPFAEQPSEWRQWYNGPPTPAELPPAPASPFEVEFMPK